MARVIHGLGGLGEIVLVTGGAWRSMRVLRTLSYCWASSVALHLRFLNRIRIFDISLKGFNINNLQLSICDSLRYSMTIVCRNFQIRNNIKVIGNDIRQYYGRYTPLALQKIMKSREWSWMWIGKLTHWFKSKDCKMPVSCLTSDVTDSMGIWNPPSAPNLEGVRTCIIVYPATHWKKQKEDQVDDIHWEVWSTNDHIRVYQMLGRQADWGEFIGIKMKRPTLPTILFTLGTWKGEAVASFPSDHLTLPLWSAMSKWYLDGRYLC